MLMKVRPIIGRPIPLGRQGEHLARRVDFGDIVEAFEEYHPNGTATLRFQRPDDSTAYEPAAMDRSGGGLIWIPTNTDTAHAGTGRVELRWTVGGTLAKSRVWDVVIEPSIVIDGDTPEEHEYYDGAYVVTPSWAEQTLETSDKICADDIKVKEIQVSETANEAGGLTISL